MSHKHFFSWFGPCAPKIAELWLRWLGGIRLITVQSMWNLWWIVAWAGFPSSTSLFHVNYHSASDPHSCNKNGCCNKSLWGYTMNPPPPNSTFNYYLIFIYPISLHSLHFIHNFHLCPTLFSYFVVCVSVPSNVYAWQTSYMFTGLLIYQKLGLFKTYFLGGGGEIHFYNNFSVLLLSLTEAQGKHSVTVLQLGYMHR